MVAGTICSVLPPLNAAKVDLLNTAIIMRGPRSVADQSERCVLMEKHYISNIDGPPQRWHANLNPTSVFSYALNPDQTLDNIIRWDGMLTGLEVCVDHKLGILQDAIVQLSDALGEDFPPIDLQTITSCGMDIDQANVVVKEGGLVLLTDGMSHNIRDYPTPLSRLARYVKQSDRFAVVDVPLPTLKELPPPGSEKSDYVVAYPNYKGKQGVYAFEPQRLGQPGFGQ